MASTNHDATWRCTVDASACSGRIRPLHGANNGPLCFGGLISLQDYHRELGFPWIRLHDCNWPADDVVDVHVIFPNFAADPDDPANYDFHLTDQYLKAILDTGARIVYRLGCRIEHTPHRRHAHPPKDFAKWAQICLGIVRHYNEGWANGHHWNLRHWEIWNEPDYPPGCWSGTWEQYYQLYAVTATRLKAHDATLQVGGPAYTYATDDHAFVDGFLTRCRTEQIPLDFFSWHTYAGRDLSVWERHACTIRSLLDQHGFPQVPSHLNEWNCHPDGDWAKMPAFTRILKGTPGASGDATSLIYFQDLPIDMAFYYTADTMVYGLFDQGGAPQKNYYALKAFRAMLDTPVRCPAEGSNPAEGIALLAGRAEDDSAIQVLFSNYVHSARQCRMSLHGLPWTGPTRVQQYRVDAYHDLALVGDETLPPGNLEWEEGISRETVALYHLMPT